MIDGITQMAGREKHKKTERLSMRRFFQAVSLSLSFLCAALFSMIGYGSVMVPDSFQLTLENGQITETAADFALPKVELPFSSTLRNPNHAGGNVMEYADAVIPAGKTEGTLQYAAQIRLLGVIPVKSAKVTVTQRRYVVPGGDVFGIKLYTKGVVVVGIDTVQTESGALNPAGKAGLKAGDILLEINGNPVSRNRDIASAVESSGGKTLRLLIKRGSKEQTLQFTPVKADTDGKYKAGIWVRDSSAGIGTLTFCDPKTGMFAGLGHAVCDVDTGEALPLSGGEAVEATVKGCYPGVTGKPGELCGVFTDICIGSLLSNNGAGVYGACKQSNQNEKQIPVALKSEVKEGKAQIIATVDGNEKQYYDVEISKVYANEDSYKKNLIIKVTDPDLIARTGGIVQGMSGSPIIQNGMLVGAVTHVFINNPLQGYGIFAQSMLEKADSLNKEWTAAALASAS